MKYLKLFELYNYIDNPDGSIDIYGDIDLRFNNLRKILVKYNKINGYFNCSWNYLTSLEGSPVEVNGYFSCHNNNLTSFQFAPKIIRGNFNCIYNNIKSFEYFPRCVKGDFWCDNNPICEVWKLFRDTTKIELLNDFDIFRGEDTDTPTIFINRLNDFLEMVGKDKVEKVDKYKNI